MARPEIGDRTSIKGKRWTSQSEDVSSTRTKSGSSPGTHTQSANSRRSTSTAISKDAPRRSARGTTSNHRNASYATSPVQSGMTGTSSKGQSSPSSVLPGPLSPGTHPVGPGLSAAAEKAIIAVAVIGGTLILALLILLCWRRRKNRVDLAGEVPRPPSTTTFLSTNTRDANLTALPRYRERRSRVGGPGIESLPPPPGMRAVQSRDASFQDLWKTANPPTPVAAQFPRSEDNSMDASRLRVPEMAQVGSARLSNPIIRVSSYEDFDDLAAESIRVPSIIDFDAESSLRTPMSDEAGSDHRSWTTSFETARSRLSSLPGIRTMRLWIGFRPNEHRQHSRIPDVEAGPSQAPGGHSRSSSGTFLKNKATKPNLAPVPTGELFVHHKRSESGRSESGSSGKKDGSVVKEEEINDVDAGIPEDGVIC